MSFEINRELLFFSFIILFYSSCRQSEYNFNEDVAPIIYENCQGCHKNGGIAPFSLTSYEDVLENAGTIEDAITTGYMPPWNADTTYRHYLYERVLTQEEIHIVTDWIRGGTNEGDSLKQPNPKDFIRQNSNTREPDFTFCMDEAYQIKGDNKDDYRTFVIPLPADVDITANAFEFKPGNVTAVHHAQVLIDTSGRLYQYDKEKEGYGFDTFTQMKFRKNGILTGYLPGRDGPVQYPKGTGKKIVKQSYAIFNIHYAPTPVAMSDQSCLDIYLSTDENPRIITGSVVNSKHLDEMFFIKAYQTKEFHAIKTMKKDVSLIAIWPHMHFRGTTFESYAITPDLDTIPLVKINNWDFNWQNVYLLDEMIHLPVNTKIHVIGRFDNRPSNPFNPVLPPVNIGWGSSSYDEMLILGMEFVNYMKDDANIKINEY